MVRKKIIRLLETIRNSIVYPFALGFLKICIYFGERQTRTREKKGQLQSIWGTTPIITILHKAAADRLLGIEGKSVVFNTYYVTNKFDINLQLLNKIGWRLLGPHFYRFVLGWALLKFDIFHYFQDRGILLPDGRRVPDEELNALKRSGKRLFFYTYGADCRTQSKTRALGKFNCCMDCDKPTKHCICVEELQTEKINAYHKYANELVAMGDMVEYVPNSYKMDFWPIDLASTPVAKKRSDTSENVLNIAHAPNHPLFKGSKYLEQFVKELNAEGLKINLLYTSGRPNKEVLETFDQCDVVADQFLIGHYGYTSLEALSRGKPVLCYIRNENMVIENSKCPIINCNPDNLKETLRWLYINKRKLAELSTHCRQYIEKYHSIPAFAMRLGQLYLEKGNLPENVRHDLRKKIASIESELSVIESKDLPKGLFPPQNNLGDLSL